MAAHPGSPITTEVGPVDAAVAINVLLPTGYRLAYAPYPEPGLADIERYVVWHVPPVKVAPHDPADRRAAFEARLQARRGAQSARRKVGVVVANIDEKAWMAFRPSRARNADLGQREIGTWTVLSAAVKELVRVDRRQPRPGDDPWRIR